MFEYYTCRHCGASYVRAYTDDVLEPTFLWHEQGGAFRAAAGAVEQLQPLDLLLEQPTEQVQRADIDLVTGAERDRRCAGIVRRLRFKGKVFRISGATGEGTRELCQAIMRELE